MPRIRCAYLGCLYREGDFCRAAEVDLDPEQGCLTFTPIEDVSLDDDWEELFEEEEDDDGYDRSEWN